MSTSISKKHYFWLQWGAYCNRKTLFRHILLAAFKDIKDWRLNLAAYAMLLPCKSLMVCGLKPQLKCKNWQMGGTFMPTKNFIISKMGFQNFWAQSLLTWSQLLCITWPADPNQTSVRCTQIVEGSLWACFSIFELCNVYELIERGVSKLIIVCL